MAGSAYFERREFLCQEGRVTETSVDILNLETLIVLQVELYADYEPRLLLPFLRSSHYYTLDKVILQFIQNSLWPVGV